MLCVISMTQIPGKNQELHKIKCLHQCTKKHALSMISASALGWINVVYYEQKRPSKLNIKKVNLLHIS